MTGQLPVSHTPNWLPTLVGTCHLADTLPSLLGGTRLYPMPLLTARTPGKQEHSDQQDRPTPSMNYGQHPVRISTMNHGTGTPGSESEWKMDTSIMTNFCVQEDNHPLKICVLISPTKEVIKYPFLLTWVMNHVNLGSFDWTQYICTWSP